MRGQGWRGGCELGVLAVPMILVSCWAIPGAVAMVELDW